jgi:hypothetical protein
MGWVKYVIIYTKLLERYSLMELLESKYTNNVKISCYEDCFVIGWNEMRYGYGYPK